eukprot:scaffold256243_cov32-Prasinocladus_malaysianus.AAC.2
MANKNAPFTEANARHRICIRTHHGPKDRPIDQLHAKGLTGELEVHIVARYKVRNKTDNNVRKQVLTQSSEQS